MRAFPNSIPTLKMVGGKWQLYSWEENEHEIHCVKLVQVWHGQ